MNIPSNFERINNACFSTNGYEFRIEIDGMNEGHVWVFCNDSEPSGFKNCLYFIFDWKSQSYNIRRCKLGDGTVGDDIVGETNFLKKEVLTKTTFIDKFLSQLTEWTINNKLFY